MSKPIYFEECNTDLKGGMKDPYGRVVEDLPVCKTDDDQIISCWRLSISERLSALVFGRVWFRTVGATHAPIAISAERTPFMPASH